MKLLFDEHFSFRSVRALQDVFPEARHVRFHSLENTSDEEIWRFAQANGYAIVTQDDDFHQRSLTFGHPPKVLWLQCGNIRRSDLEALLRSHAALVEEFLTTRPESLLVLH